MSAEASCRNPSELALQLGGLDLAGSLSIPEQARGLVLFAHGSGSSRHSPRNRYVARTLNEGGLATLLFDLLAPSEEAVDLQTGELHFEVELLAERLVGIIDWVGHDSATPDLPVALFSSSTGAAAALMAAARRPAVVRAVVSRGGRPDLAGAALPQVTAPTLLLVGGRDTSFIVLNEEARRRMPANPKLEIIPGAGHLFEEAGALEEVAQLACRWFLEHLSPHSKLPTPRPS